MTGLKPYMAYVTGMGPEEGACLIFVHDTREAKKMAWPIIESWWTCDYTDLRVKKLVATEYIMSLAGGEEPHCIESPPVCTVCGLWNDYPPGECSSQDGCPGKKVEP